jgi:hypothetical protein
MNDIEIRDKEIDEENLSKKINMKYQKDNELIKNTKNSQDSLIDDLNLDLEVMQKNISTIVDKIPLKIRFRWFKGFIRRLIRSAILMQESFNSATYRVIKILTNNYKELSKKIETNSNVENKVKELEKRVDELSNYTHRLEEKVKLLNHEEHEEKR